MFLGDFMNPISDKHERLIDSLWMLVLIGVSFAWCISAADALSATFDEPTYIECGLAHWNTGSYKGLMRLGTMPLAIDVQTFPLHVWEKRTGSKLDLNRDIGWAIRIARAGTLVFWTILLLYMFRIGHSLGGSWGGRMASALVAFEPCMLGHAAIAGSDIAVTACLVAFAYEFKAGREKSWKKRVGIPAVLYGVALLTKASALVFAPVFMLVIEFERLCRLKALADIPVADWRERLVFLRNGMWKFRSEFFTIIGFGLLVTFLYIRSDWATEPTFVQWVQTLPPGKLHDVMLHISEHLKIFTNAGEGIAQQIKHNMRGHGTFILGRDYKRAVWYYFPVALAIKASILFLLAPFGVVAVRARRFLNWPCLCAIVLLAYSVSCRVQIGIRFMFPLMALAAAGVGAGGALALRESQNTWKRTALAIFFTLGLIYNVAVCWAVWPEGICYTNEFWGGTSNGYVCLSDSNYDWGQGLKELLKWREAHNVEVIDVWYFGLDPRVNIHPMRKMQLNEENYTQGQPLEKVMKGKCVAISTTMLDGAYLDKSPSGQAAVAFFKTQKPIGRTTTYIIYDFRQF
jgi:hypothetical protein